MTIDVYAFVPTKLLDIFQIFLDIEDIYKYNSAKVCGKKLNIRINVKLLSILSEIFSTLVK